MIKTLKKLAAITPLIFLTLTLCSCQDIIFANIRKEVKLEPGTVPGSINSIVRFENYLYVANGGSVFRKSNNDESSSHSYGNWHDLGNNMSGEYIVNLAADQTNLYALTATWGENSSRGQNRWNGRYIWTSTDGSSWKKIETIPTDQLNENTAIRIFCTNTIKPDNRKAYYNYGGTVKELKGTGSPTAASGAGSNSRSCVYVNGKVEFFDGYAACTNESKTTTTATHYYYSSGGTLYLAGGGTSDNFNVGGIIYSIGVTSDYVLVGTSEGIKHYKRNSTNGSLDHTAAWFDTNADAIMASTYEVNALLVINPERSEYNTAIYSAIDFTGRTQQYDHVCLWAYYPSRREWNRD